jgi:hypothetical protein
VPERRDIGWLLLTEGRAAEAYAELQPVHEDLCLLYGPDHPDAREVADALARLRLSGAG